jgi:transposase
MPISISRDEIRAIYRQGEDVVILRIESLVQRLNTLEDKIAKLEGQISKNSNNSHKPPASDGFCKKVRINLREKSDRKNGGQKGHPGHTLQLSDTPNEVKDHWVKNECDCGFNLNDIGATEFERRQIFNIPKIKPEVTEHRAWAKQCPRCGKIHKAKFPNNITAPVQYGSSVKATATYLNHYQLIPLERTVEVFRHLFQLPISEGSLIRFTQQAYDGLEKTDEVIVENIRDAEVGHFDESGMYVNKKRGWLNVAATQLFTHYFFHDKRGKEAMDAVGILPYFTGTAVHDGLKAYFLYLCKHGLCNVHHLRELKFQIEQCKQGWAGDMKKHLLCIKLAVDTAKKEGKNCLDKETIERFENKYNGIIVQGYQENPKLQEPKIPGKRGRRAQSSALNLLDRLKKYYVEVLRFMHDFNVPFENNLAERDGRMVKLQQKISGCFRTKDGADRFCRIRSFISTIKKHNLDVFDALHNIFEVNDGSVCLLPNSPPE